MLRLPENIEALRPYSPGKPISHWIEELQLKKWALLWNNENNYGPSPRVSAAISNAAGALHRYPDPNSSQLKEAIAAHCGGRPGQVVVENGSEALIDNIFRAFFSPGDHLLCSEHSFVAVHIWSKANRVPVDIVPMRAGFQYDMEAMLSAIRPETKAVYLANPNNPTGSMVNRQELNWFVQHMPEHVLLIVDEAYREYACELTQDYPDAFRLNAPNVIALRTFSKAYALAGMRVGYAIGPERLIGAMSKVKMTFAPSLLAQMAALAALGDDDHLERCSRANAEAIKLYGIAMAETGAYVCPGYGNFLMMDMGSHEAAEAFTTAMMRTGVFIRHLTGFGLPNCVRISTGTPDENTLFLNALSGHIEKSKHMNYSNTHPQFKQ